MKCSTKSQASRIAYFGALKMADAGYKVALVQNPNPRGSVAYVQRSDGYEYPVLRDAQGRLTCRCPFFQENAQFGVCKHTMKVRWEIEEQASLNGPDELDAAIAQADQDEALAGQGTWTNPGTHCEACGTRYIGQGPCDRCAKRAL